MFQRNTNICKLNPMSSEGSDFSNGFQYEMEDESRENRNYEYTDIIYSYVDTDSDTDIEAYLDKLIADEGWLEDEAKFLTPASINH